jgi:hypothetical protein
MIQLLPTTGDCPEITESNRPSAEVLEEDLGPSANADNQLASEMTEVFSLFAEVVKQLFKSLIDTNNPIPLSPEDSLEIIRSNITFAEGVRRISGLTPISQLESFFASDLPSLELSYMMLKARVISNWELNPNRTFCGPTSVPIWAFTRSCSPRT